MKIVIAGSSGFIGTQLTLFFQAQGHLVIGLTRKKDVPGTSYWDPDTKTIDPSVLKGAEVVINLSGESILGRWNEEKMREIRNSRIRAAELLCDTILALPSFPQLYIGASAIGYYGDRPGEILNESSAAGTGFLADLCQEWERIPDKLVEKGIRVVQTRFGIVLGHGGALKHMEKAFRAGMGGVLGSGKQVMSWIAIDDLRSAMHYLLIQPAISGPVNFTAPYPVTNQLFTQTMGHVLNKPTVITIPKFALGMMFGAGAENLLASDNVQPEKLLSHGYEFQFPELEPVLKKYLS